MNKQRYYPGATALKVDGSDGVTSLFGASHGWHHRVFPSPADDVRACRDVTVATNRPALSSVALCSHLRTRQPGLPDAVGDAATLTVTFGSRHLNQVWWGR